MTGMVEERTIRQGAEGSQISKMIQSGAVSLLESFEDQSLQVTA